MPSPRDDDTPNLLPGNGAVPHTVEPEDTGEILLSAAGDLSNAELIQSFIAAIDRKLSSGDSGGGAPKHVKQIKRHNWMTALAVLLFGSGGIVAAHYATEARSKTNSEAIQAHDVAIKDNTTRIVQIKYSLDSVGAEVSKAVEGQREIANGIRELKQENVDSLKAELRELRRERRRDR